MECSALGVDWKKCGQKHGQFEASYNLQIDPKALLSGKTFLQLLFKKPIQPQWGAHFTNRLLDLSNLLREKSQNCIHLSTLASAQGQPRSSKPLLRTPQSGWNWKLSFESTKYSYLLFFAGKSLKQARWQYLVNLIDMWPSFSFVAELWRVLVKGVQDRYMPFFKKIYGRADCMSPFQLSSRQSGFCSCLARIFKKKKK